MIEIFWEHEVTLDRIEALLKQALIPCKRHENGESLLLGEGDHMFGLFFMPKLKLIQFARHYRVPPKKSEGEKLRFVNELNHQKQFVRFLWWEGVLVCTYSLVYEGGISPAKIISAYRRFVAESEI